MKLSEINFGKAEAEAELTTRSGYLLEVFDDFIDAIKKIESDDSFLVVGRKGTGKSAIAKVLSFEDTDHSLKFAKTLNSSDLKLGGLVHQDKSITEVGIFHWLLLVSLVELILKCERISYFKEYKLLQEFLDKNAGYIKVNGKELIDEITRYSGNVSIEALSKIMEARYGKSLEKEFKSKKAPFYKIIPNLEKLLITVLSLPEMSGTSFKIFIDDVDVIFQQDLIGDKFSEFLRLVRDLNTKTFNNPSINIRVIVFVRPDQLQKLQNQPDVAKILQSYNVSLRWYSHSGFIENEDDIPLKKMINRRISNSLGQNVKMDPWDYLFDRASFEGSSFKYVLDRTMYRPRDLINLLNCLKERYGDKSLPITKTYFDKSIEYYSSILGEEIQNEIVMSFNEETESILDILRDLEVEFTFDEFKVLHQREGILMDPVEILEILYMHGVVGIKGLSGIRFNYWGNPFVADDCQKIVKHFALRKFLSHGKSYSLW
jgi:hypothetical protein